MSFEVLPVSVLAWFIASSDLHSCLLTFFPHIVCVGVCAGGGRGGFGGGRGGGGRGFGGGGGRGFGGGRGGGGGFRGRGRS